MNKKYCNILLYILLILTILCAGIGYAAEDKTAAIDISEPANNSITFENKIVIRGKAYNTVKLFVENRAVVLGATGEFNAPFTLPFYGNHYVKLIAYNKQNETTIKYLTVNYIKPQDKPTITIISPENNIKTGASSIRIRGYVNNCSQVYIDKKPIKLINKDGKTFFDEEVNLIFIGVNKILITGHSLDDKDLTEELNITKVAAYKPGQDVKLLVYYPVNNLETTAEKINIKGKGLNISKVYMNDELLKMDKENNFNVETMLQYGSNTLEIIGIGPNDVSIKETRTVVRLNNEMEKQKNQVIHIETKDANRKLTSFDFISAEKDRIEEKLNKSIQRIIDSTIGPNKAIFSVVINLNTAKIKNDLDKEFEGDINRFIQLIDCNVILDSNSKNTEPQIKNIIRQNLDKFTAVKQNYSVKYISFSDHKESPYRMPEIKVSTKMTENPKKENDESSLLNHIVVKQQAVETELRDFYQKYIDHVVGDNHAVIDFKLILNKALLKAAIHNKQEDEILSDFDQYVLETKVIILFDNTDNKQFEQKIKTLLNNSINRFGNYNLKLEFIYEKFDQRHSEYNPKDLIQNKNNRNYLITAIAFAVVSILLIIAGFAAIFLYLRNKLDLAGNNNQSKEPGTSNNNEGSRMRLSDLPNMMKKSESINILHSDNADKGFFTFINENNIHKLKLVLGLQIIKNEASFKNIAIIISYLEASLAAKVVMMYPPKIQAQIMDMLIEPSQYPSEEIYSIEKDVKSSMDGIVGGNTHLLKILENLSQKSTKSIFDELEEKYPTTFRSLKPSVIIFEDLINLEDKDLEILLKEIEPKTIAMAISNSSTEEKEKVIALLSLNGKDMVNEWLELKNNKIKELEVEESRRFIISVAQVLESMSEIKIQKSRSAI